jgi:spermidine/putrescine transport system permease protein
VSLSVGERPVDAGRWVETGARRRAVSRGGRSRPGIFSVYYVLLLLLLYLPIGILVLFSFNTRTSFTFPLDGLTFDWYGRALDTPAAVRSARNSLVVAVGSSLAATALATAVAILAVRFRFPGKRLLLGLAVLPLIVPYVVLGVALLLLFAALEVERSLWTVGIAHAVVAIPYALLIVAARLAGMDPDLEEAAMDLGARYPTALRLVVLPQITPAIVAAWLVAFTASFDEFALALFLTGPEPTLPVFIYGQLRFSSRFPMLVALALLVMSGTLLLAFVAERLRRIGGRRQASGARHETGWRT